MKTYNCKGFTFVELMISMTIVLVVISGVLSVFVAVNRSMVEVSETMSLNIDSRFTHGRLLYDLRSVYKVNTGFSDLSFTGEFYEIATGVAKKLTYQITADGKLVRTVSKLDGSDPDVKIVMRDLITDPSSASRSRFTYINRNGSGSSAPASNAAEVRSIQVTLVPKPTDRQRLNITHGRPDPFCTALVQLRNLTN